MDARKAHYQGKGKHKAPLILYKKPAVYKQPGEKAIAFFDEVAKPPKIDLLPGTVLFVPPPRGGSYLVKNTVGG